MKNIFGINNEKTTIDGEIYLDREISLELKNELEDSRKELDDVNKKVTKPTYLSAIYSVGFIYIMIVIYIITLGLKDKIPFMDIVKKNLVLIVIAIVVIMGLILLIIFNSKKIKKVVESEETKSLVSDAEAIVEKCYKELNIPSDHIEMDVLCYIYEEKDGKEKRQKSLGIEYISLSVIPFIEDNYLCLADLETVLKIPLNEFTQIIKLKKKMSFVNWNKEEQPKNNKYKGYKVIVQNDVIYTVSCYQVIIDSTFGKYEIIIPEYEHDNIIKLLNIGIVEE